MTADGPVGEAPVRVLLVDDHPLYRSGLRSMAERATGVCCVGEAASGEEALALLETLECDVVLMDLRMPGIGGLEATRLLVDAHSSPPAVVVLTMVEDDEAVAAALRAGARGYVLKGADAAELVAAIIVVARGGMVMGPVVAASVLARWHRSAPGPALPFPHLTAQERRVLELLATGRSTSGIAAALSLSTKTVRNYLSSTYAKLGVADRYEAIALAREHGLGR